MVKSPGFDQNSFIEIHVLLDFTNIIQISLLFLAYSGINILTDLETNLL